MLPTLFAAVTFGPIAGMVVAAATMLGDFRAPYLKWAIYTLSRALTGAITGLVAVVTSTAADQPFISVAIATVAGAFTAEVLDTGFACIIAHLRHAGRATRCVLND